MLIYLEGECVFVCVKCLRDLIDNVYCIFTGRSAGDPC